MRVKYNIQIINRTLKIFLSWGGNRKDFFTKSLTQSFQNFPLSYFPLGICQILLLASHSYVEWLERERKLEEISK